MKGAGVTPQGDGGDGKERGTPLCCHLSEGFGGDELGGPGGCFGEDALGWVFLKSTSPPLQTVWVGWEVGGVAPWFWKRSLGFKGMDGAFDICVHSARLGGKVWD